MMDERIVLSHAEFWPRARRHLLKYGGEFVGFVPVRAGDTLAAGGLAALPNPTRALSAGWTGPL
jgi:hypothetical protein